MGWATVTHPFHPLFGKRFSILKSRNCGGQEMLSLFDPETGSLSLPREWTDQARETPYAGLLNPPPVLDAGCLLKLRDLIENIKKND